MYALYRSIPDPEVIIAMEPEELAAKILFLLQSQQQNISPHNLENEVYNSTGSAYPQHSWDEVGQAIREAFAWLVAQGLLVPARGQFSGSGWMTLSRRARAFADEGDFQAYRDAKMLDKEGLHARISAPVWQAFVRGEYDVAVFQAMKAVEVAVKEASGLTELLGVRLMRTAFHPQTGPLADMTVDEGERDARMNLFVGAIGSYKNPQSHRDVNLDNPREAIEIIMLANHLLRIIEVHRQQQG
ncbi:TIGR02391 family protein [Rhizobium croatiense]|uniref:TIGR02391 family protein n=1 Tax=Rhizobium croatiense TaxID=2867516 RepID=UPI0023ED470C|nr:TIGR02391 family protein [Rhizobium croatiense]WET75506.1 TIGR02391 family protein [Rhizobium croatiense]